MVPISSITISIRTSTATLEIIVSQMVAGCEHYSTTYVVPLEKDRVASHVVSFQTQNVGGTRQVGVALGV